MSSEDFKSFVVTDPDILDEGIDISGIKRTTDTSPLLLGDLQPGLRYDPTLQSSYSDLLQYFSGGLPMLPETPAVVPPATGGGGTGGGGQATTPITTPITTPTTGGGVTNVDTPLTQMVTDPVTGQTQTVKQAMTSDAAYTGTLSDPFLASGAAGGASLVRPTTATTTLPSGDVFATDDPMLQEKIDFTPEQQGTIQNILGQAGQTVEGALTELGKIPGAIIDAVNQTVDIFGKKINVGKTLASAAINQKVGGPVSLIFETAKGLLPERDPIQTKLEELYDVKDGTIQSGLMKGYNPVSGNPLDPTFGLQEAYQDRIDTIENTLKDKYNLSATDIAGIKAGTFNTEKLDAQTDLVQRLVDLEDAKKKEADVLGITAAEDKRKSEAQMRQTIADAERDFKDTPTTTGVNPFADIDTGVGEFDTTPVTGVTKPGTVLGKPPIEKFDDAEAALSNTGTSIDALNPNNRQLHFDNTDKLKAAAQRGEITDDEYKRLSAFDATKTMGLDPVTGTLSSIAYQTVQAAAGDQTVGNAISDIANNISGVAGNITPEEQVKYQEIITGEKIYRDPILGMVEPSAPMTLADDTINRMVDDVDLDLFDTTPVDTTPIATDRIGTFDADTFDDDVSFVGPQPTTTELTDSDFTAQDRQDIFNRERELENEYIEETGQIPTPDRFLGQAIDEKVQEKTREQQTITPLEDDFDFDEIQTYEPPSPPQDDGGRDRDPDPAPSAPAKTSQGVTTSQFQAFRDPAPSKPAPSLPNYGPPSVSSGGGNGGGGGGGGSGCVIATHAVNSGAFTKDTKREAVRWCVKNLHRTWWGEAIRRGYRYYGQKAIEEGKAKNHYQEFKDYVAFGTGKRRTLKTGWTFVYRSIQFFIRGLIDG